MTAMGATPYEIMRAIPFDLPPKEFNPSEATEDSLRRYGFPVGPWRGSWKRTCSLIQPEFGKSEQTKRHYFEKAGDWAGVEVMAPEGDTIDAVRAVWTIPKAYFPEGANGDMAYAASSWVGIDGDHGSTDILQVGVDSMVYRAGRKLTRAFVAWWEWVPSDREYAQRNFEESDREVKNFDVSAGDTVDCQIYVEHGDRKQASIRLYNRNSGVARSFLVKAPKDTELRGNCVEWIVERIDYKNNFVLARYDDVEFEDAEAITNRSGILRPGAKGVRWRDVEMVERECVISRGSCKREGRVLCTYVNPARAMRAAAGKEKA